MLYASFFSISHIFIHVKVYEHIKYINFRETLKMSMQNAGRGVGDRKEKRGEMGSSSLEWLISPLFSPL